jgi:hypothetical protein
VAATRSTASRVQSRLLIRIFDISPLPGQRSWATAGGSNGYQVLLARRQLTPGLISSLPKTAGLRPFISFSTSYPEIDSLRHARCVGPAEVRNCEGFRMPALHRPLLSAGTAPAFENLQGRKPRVGKASPPPRPMGI